MKTREAWNKIDELKKHPELANSPGYEMEELRKAVDPVYWFLLLMEQPQFAPPRDWWFELRHRSDLPWARLLAAQPQFEGHCHWESVRVYATGIHKFFIVFTDRNRVHYNTAIEIITIAPCDSVFVIFAPGEKQGAQANGGEENEQSADIS